MIPLRVRDLLQSMMQILSRHGIWCFFEFAALSVAITTLYALIAPESFAMHFTRQADASMAGMLTDPVLLVAEAAYALLFALACLRIWEAHSGRRLAGDDRKRKLLRGAVPLVVLGFVASTLAYLGLILFIAPGLMVVAITSLIAPAVMVEGRGWRSILRSLRMTGGHVTTLTIAWAAIGMPLLFLGVMLGPDAALEAVPGAALWQAWIVSDLLSAAFSAASVALVMATYATLLEAEAGGGQRLPEVFR